MLPTERRVRARNIDLCVFEWGAPTPGEPTLLLAHATGFHARCWDPVVTRLETPTHAVAVDLRGHGRSDKPPVTHWRVFGEDLADVVHALDLREIVGVGHSMGGHAMTDAAAACAKRFRRLVLIDPVITRPDDYAAAPARTTGAGGTHPTARRKDRFRSHGEMLERFRDRPPYSEFHSEALHGYCEHGLVAAPDGEGFVLACPPAIEADTYRTSRTNSAVHASARALDIPVLIVRAKLPPPDRSIMDFSSSPTWPGLVGAFRHGREVHLADRSHFIPLETPGEVAALIDEELATLVVPDGIE